MIKMDLSFITKEIIDDYASIHCELFGNILLKVMHYDAECVLFCKCTSETDAYNIAWCLENDDQYIGTFYIDELLTALKGRELELTMNII